MNFVVAFSCYVLCSKKRVLNFQRIVGIEYFISADLSKQYSIRHDGNRQCDQDKSFEEKTNVSRSGMC